MKINFLPTVTLTAALALLTAAPAGAFAQATPAAADKPAKKEAVAKMNNAAAGGFTAADKKLIKTAAQSDETEISMAKIALSRSENAEIKRYAQMMIDDHGKTSLQLKPLADAAGVAKPDLKAKDKATATRLQTLSGGKFDLAYLQANARGHRDVAAKMRLQAPGVTNPDLKSFATETLPIVEHHAMMAQEMAAKMGAGTTSGGAKKAGM